MWTREYAVTTKPADMPGAQDAPEFYFKDLDPYNNKKDQQLRVEK